MQCRHCQADNPDLSRFCDHCGTAFPLACAGCGAVARAGARFCSQCGAGLSAASPELVPPPPAASAAMFRLIDEGERKVVTVLFADIRGSTSLIEALDPEQAMNLLDPAVHAMALAVQKFGGTVNRVQGDGIMALFGAPVATEDHAVRACLAAQAIVAAVAAETRLVGVAAPHAELEVRVGLNSGDVVIRSVGQDPSDYDAVGVTVHLAHRMETSAVPGTVRLTGRTALLAHGTVDLEDLGPQVVAGIAGPVDVFRLISAYERPAWDVRSQRQAMTGFVGRDSELRLLETTLGRVGLGRGQVVTLTADAGVGKSRLVHEFLMRPNTGAWSVIRAAAISHGEGTPYRLAADILRAWLGVERRDGRADVARKLGQALLLLGLSDPAEAAPLQSLLDLPVIDPAWSNLSADVRRERMLPALRLVMLRASAVRPMLLVVEDLHWADPQSELLLEALVEALGGARVLLVVTTRPERRPAWASRGNRSYCLAMHLGPLAPAAAEALLTELLGSGPELAALRARIVAQADGTPLFIEELSRALIEQGVVVVEQPTLAMPRLRLRLTRDLTEVQIPPNVQAILANRIDQLTSEPRRLLQVAAVIGRDIPRDILASVADLTEALLTTNLVALQAAEFIYEISRLAGTDYTFKHALTQTVAYEGMLRRQRRELHARVLSVMENLAADRADELTEVLAEHAQRGEVWDRAAALLERAGHRANARSAWVEAIRFFDGALHALAQVPETRKTIAVGIDIRLGLRVALGPTSQIPRVLQIVDEASEMAEQLGDFARLAQIDISRCIFLSIQGSLDRAVDAGRRAQRAARTLGDPAAQVSAAYALGQTHWMRGDFADAAATMEECLTLVRGPMRLHNTGTTGTASVLLLSCLSKTYAMTGAFEPAFALAAEAQAIANETIKPYDVTYARLASGFAELQRGDGGAAVDQLEAALASCRAGGIGLLVPSVARYLGRAYALVGRAQEALALLDEAMETARGPNMVLLIVWCGLALGHAQLVAGAEDMALAQLEESLSLARHHGYRPAEVLALRLLAEAHATGLRHSQAHDFARACDLLARELGLAPEQAALAILRVRLDSASIS